MTKKTTSLVPVERIEHAILLIRGHKVILDSDLALLYGVTTKRLNEQVRRNRPWFPEDFLFQLTRAEFKATTKGLPVVELRGVAFYDLDRDGLVTSLHSFNAAVSGPQFKLLARNSLGETCQASYAVSGMRIFIRTERNLYAISTLRRSSPR